MVDFEAAKQYYQRREAQRQAQREVRRREWLQRVREAVISLAGHYPGVRRVYLFGSVVQLGRFKSGSDIDLALECDSLEAETAFWRALERHLQRDVDMRPMTGAIAQIVATSGEMIYERQDTFVD